MERIRQVWPNTRIIVRGDRGFCRESLMQWCESSGVAYVLLQALRQHGLCRREFAKARCDTIRLKLLKLAAVVKVTVRRMCFSLSQAGPCQKFFAQVLDNLRTWNPLPVPTTGEPVAPAELSRLDASPTLPLRADHEKSSHETLDEPRNDAREARSTSPRAPSRRPEARRRRARRARGAARRALREMRVSATASGAVVSGRP